MSKPKSIYLVVTGAGAARCVPDLLDALAQFDLPCYTFLTQSAHMILSPYNLADHQGHTLVESYFDPVLVGGREPGITIVAPATFNTVNKMSQGIADTLAHSLVAEAIGGGWPVIVAPALNPELANHPQYARSIKLLQEWGVTVLEPRLAGERLMMAPVENVVTAVKQVLEATKG